ncbi:calcium-binding protein PBP1-like [Musa acuminata AAA Group]|uniref:calcium-binding protein PBP1-like n=1 Tax=Musa acuminata AAA Group TaxID=214697 RepID=UPI0031D06B15
MATSSPVTFFFSAFVCVGVYIGMAASAAVTVSEKGMAAARDSMGFQDFLPRMAERLGAEGLMEELCKGFKLLMDPERGVITSESLRRNVAALGLVGLGDDELMGMVREGDLNGDGVLDQMEFCVLMVRLSPELIEGSLPDVFNSSPAL